MSQQINLVLSELRPRFDWLGLPVVLAAAVLGLLLAGGVYANGRLQIAKLQAQELVVKGQLAGLQQQVQVFAQAITGRKGDAGLPRAIAEQRTGNLERKDVLEMLASGAAGESRGYASALQGLSRQTLEGLWLTRFVLASGAIELHGALLSPSLLPRYIDKLNTEAAFSGRHFAALDMTGIEAASKEPLPTLGAASSVPASAVAQGAPLRHTAFVLRSSLQAPGETAR